MTVNEVLNPGATLSADRIVLAVPTNLEARLLSPPDGGDMIYVTWVHPVDTTNINYIEVQCASSKVRKIGKVKPKSYSLDVVGYEHHLFPPIHRYTVGKYSYYSFRIRSVLIVPWESSYAIGYCSEWTEFTVEILASPFIYTLEYPSAPDLDREATAELPLGSVRLTFTPCSNLLAETIIFCAYKTGHDAVGNAEYVLDTACETVAVPSATWSNVTGLSLGRQYRFAIQYHIPDSNIYSHTSPWSVDYGVGNVLSPPTNVIAVFAPDIATRAVVTWTDNSWGESLYEVWRFQDPSGPWQHLVNVDRKITSFMDNTVSLYYRYMYGVKARSGDVVSDFAFSNYIPQVPADFQATFSGYDSDLQIGQINYSVPWVRHYDWPYAVTIEVSYDGEAYSPVINLPTALITGTPVPVVLYPDHDVYIRVTASNGSGWKQIVIQTSTVTLLFTIAAPPAYYPGSPVRRSLIWSPDGAGELSYTLGGVVNHGGYTYGVNIDGVGTLNKDIEFVELLSMPFGQEWYGGKTVHGVETELTSPRDTQVRVDSRDDYKDELFNQGKDVTLHKTGRTGYIKAGREFQVRVLSRFGAPHDFKLWGARVWLKLTGRQGLNTIPLFYGRRGYREENNNE